MLIVLPNAKNGLPALLTSLTSDLDNFERVLSTSKYDDAVVDLGLPVFSISGDTLDLQGVLSRMGLASIFKEGKADFSGMDGCHNAFISSVIHKALIDVSPSLWAFELKLECSTRQFFLSIS